MNLQDIFNELGMGHLINVDIFGKKDSKKDSKIDSKIDDKNEIVTKSDSKFNSSDSHEVEESVDEIARRILGNDERDENAVKKNTIPKYNEQKNDIKKVTPEIIQNSHADDTENKKDNPPKKIINEENYVFYKTYKCPICSSNIKNLTVKTGKSRVLSRDWDLRPRYSDVDALKYDIVHCNYCGYAALTSYFSVLPKAYKDLVKINICDNYKPMSDDKGVISYRRAIKKYQLALLNAIARNAKDSEKAMICIKLAWIIRGLLENEEVSNEEKAGFLENEERYLNYARVGFEYALTNEQAPIAFLDEQTYFILLASLEMHFNNYNDAIKLLANVVYSKVASSHQKEKARELVFEIRDCIRAEKKKKQEN